MKMTVPHNKIIQPKDVDTGRGEKSQFTTTDFLSPLEIQKMYPFNRLYRRVRQPLIHRLSKRKKRKRKN